jgi:formate C-acetyltransferase
MIAWAERYAAEAEKLASQTTEPQRRAELLQIAERCRRVPAEPPRSFAEALQSVWFLYVALYLETLAASCLGRLDQYLLPYYTKDLESGALTRLEAKELLCCLWVKLYENVLGVLGNHAQTITLGGLLPDRSSGVNDLSFLCIEVAEAMGNVGAQIALRWFDGTDPALTARVFDLMDRRAVMPQIFNDHTYIAALERLGVPFKDASQFALFGCHEPVISGMGYQRPASWPGYVSFYDWLERALGLESFGSPPKLRVVAGPPSSAGDLWDRWVGAMRQGVRKAVIRANFGDKVKRELLPRPLMSAFLRDCIEKGADMTQGGARYNMTGFQGCALATAVDSFLAVKELVFERKTVAMSDLVDALLADFQGKDALREMLWNQASKYGTDGEEADVWAQRMVEAFCDEIESHRNLRGGRFAPGLWSFVQNVHFGYRTAASPDGRRAGQPISHSMDPVSGQAVKGPTAVLKSAAKLAQKRLSNGGSLLLEFSSAAIADKHSRSMAQALCETYLRMGGIEMQLSCSSVDELLEARKHPERYRDLVVRVAGYSDFFVRLSPDLQNYIIEREKHVLGA